MPSPAPSPPATSNAGLDCRLAAWQVLQAVAAGAYADAALERQLARLSLSPLDRALATELAYGAIRQRDLLDAWIDALGRVAAQRQPPRLRWLLHVGLYQLLFCQRIPEAAAVNTSVELARQGGLARLAPVVNAVLRSLLRKRPDRAAEPWRGLPLPADPAASLALRHSLPGWLASELLRWLPATAAEAFARHSNSPPPLDLRCRLGRCQRPELLAALRAAGIAAEPLPDSSVGLTLPGRGGNLRTLPGYAEGWWSVQDRHAQCIVPLLDLRPGQRVLDACAAPGGKTTQIAEILQGQGQLWAVDRSAARLQRLELNAKRLRLPGITLLAADACELGAQHPDWHESFDRILLDAPCSGLGTLARHADARWRLQPEAIDGLVALQDRLLRSLLPLLAPAGRLVYATCTLHPRENQARIAALLAEQPQWQLLQERQWWPWRDEEQGGQAAEAAGDGFYCAVLERAPAQGEGGATRGAGLTGATGGATGA